LITRGESPLRAAVAKPTEVRAAIYVLVACMAVIVQGAWSEFQGYAASLSRAAEVTQAVSLAVSRSANDTLRIAEQQLVGATAEGPKVPDQHQSGRAGFGPVMAYDGNGTLLWTSGPLDGSISLTAPAEIAALYAKGETAQLVTPLATATGATDTMFAVSRPLEDVPGGFVMALVLPAALIEFFSTFADNAALTISLTDEFGRTIVGLNSDSLPADGTAALARELFSPEGHELLNDGAAPHSALPGRVIGHSVAEHFPVMAVVTIGEADAVREWQSWLPLRVLLLATTVAILALLGQRLADQVRGRTAVEVALQRREAEFRLLAESAADVVQRVSSDGKSLYVSPAVTYLLGYPQEELIGTTVLTKVHAEDRHLFIEAAARLKSGGSVAETVAVRMLHSDGHEIWVETSMRPSGDGTAVTVSRDISDRKQLEQKLESLARLDGLTGLANRRAFDDTIHEEVARSARSGRPLSLLMIDADQFKRFNDEYGHLAGDACLKSIASVVQMAARRPGDLAARYGGEEMALLLPDTEADRAHEIARNLCRQVETLRIPHERNLPWKIATISVGVAAVDPRVKNRDYSSEWLISTADLALYDAKSQGRNQAIAAPKDSEGPVRLVG
jgi:diguanylate cyclase (GGDEF)-like protein/PAS domain S-box-containing protein